MKTVTSPQLRVAKRLTLTGSVQGIGMRPAIARLAEQSRVHGFVRNTCSGVEVHVEGDTESVARFTDALRSHLPTASELDSLQQIAAEVEQFDSFAIIQPSELNQQDSLTTRVPADLVVCDRCREEIRDAANRRYDYPFTSCTDCGPRYSIIQRMPYERSQTSMTEFALCETCQAEYASASDRRFHSQTNACSKCGPQLWACDANHRTIAGGHDAIELAATAIRNGQIVALRGLGGYQLIVDAGSQSAIERLRRRKQRQGKPLAVMVGSLSKAEPFATMNDVEREQLTCSAGPIVVAAATANARICRAVTQFASESSAQSAIQELGTIGLFLPTTPLHQRLLDRVDGPLVCTSGNLEGEPLAFERDAAMDDLHSIADVWLHHDRPITRPIDDSVVRVIAGRAVSLRLARGYAPLNLNIVIERPTIAVGGHQKVAIALSNGRQSLLGPHIGDMNTIAARQRFADQVHDLTELYGVHDFDIVCDLHPDYFTTQWSQNQPNRCVQVQHHHAHIAAGMLQHGWQDQQVLGVAFDGTGYGTDGTIWGGEFLRCTASSFERVGHLRQFGLVGGDQAIREPWRVATSLVRDALGDSQAAELSFQSRDARTLIPLLSRPALSTVTTSAGRLFDGVAALVLQIESCQYEGQAAISLEAVCDQSALGHYRFPIIQGQPKIVDWRPMIRELMQDRADGVPPDVMAMRFHRGLAIAITEFCDAYSPLSVVLGGGVFQNRILVELLADQMRARPLGLPGMIPVGDGGLAAGQLLIADALARQGSSQLCA
ncbi:Carbamoyltransferase HypF [Rubripirellula amarantea]|uniref:Carbamoyltransferase n=1 Tax=Rubripirellula amarantea TaxID=2527999 RepID=A0A5C5WE95_9BACT|nr:carbamoyltransferase HypF [Rubripirellula amarantea]TWT48052.1 Carbamoyltransferase HypF [Rubripirellula amarantea]